MSDSHDDEWPVDYEASRAAFRVAASAIGAELTDHEMASRGPNDEALTVDVATLGQVNASHLIVVTSGVHGVEGHLGAAVQRRIMRMIGEAGLDANVRMALVHAVNPWGFANDRRTDENNVDVNRNVIVHGHERPSRPTDEGYAALDPIINPREPPTRAGEFRFWSRALGLIVRERGIASLAAAIAEGQDRYPKGLFFAGTAAGEASRHLQRTLQDLVGDARRVTHLDVHSGLGPSAAVTLIARTDIGSDDTHAERLARHFGQTVRLDDAAANAYDAQGTLARWYGDGGTGDARFVSLCVEVGTVNPLRVLSALKRENQAHHWATPGTADHQRAKRALRETFAPRSRRWRDRSVAAALHTFERALALPPDPDASDA